MALSQVQCLEESNVNHRTNESRPEFYYSEAQRLAVETLVTRGREAFDETIRNENLRAFLSELEVRRLLSSAREYLPEPEPEPEPDPGAGEPGEPGAGGPGEPPLSQLYWPDHSDVERPGLDLGWPDSSSYRGVTRATVYTQPPVDGTTHIKEVVRRMIAGAQKVIAVVMDLFTDIDIFKDILDASFKRKVPAYIIHDQTNIKYFFKMCESSGMHMGMLKVSGQKWSKEPGTKSFMLIDGDRAVSGSYSFTWTGSRLDRNIITVLSGQVVETFDKEFRELLHFSKVVNMSQLNLAPVPSLTPEQSAAIARKLINPKYALVRLNMANGDSSSSDKKSDSNKDKNQQLNTSKKQTASGLPEIPFEEPTIDQALMNMPKIDMLAYMFSFGVQPQENSEDQKSSTNTKERDCGPVQSSQAQKQVEGEADVPRKATDNDTQTKRTNKRMEKNTGVNLLTAQTLETQETKHKANTTDHKVKSKMRGMKGSLQHRNKLKSKVLDNDTRPAKQTVVYSSACKENGEGRAIETSEGIKDVITSTTGEAEVPAESNETEGGQENGPDETELEEDCVSNPSTNCTPDWISDTSLSSESDDFYECDDFNGTVKKVASEHDGEQIIGEVNHCISRGTFESPLNHSKNFSHSMNDIRDGYKIVSKNEAAIFLREVKEQAKKKALDNMRHTFHQQHLQRFCEKSKVRFYLSIVSDAVIIVRHWWTVISMARHVVLAG
uniref:Scaffolding anchor of CK1 domain-containing protein n=1 Tax=Callorhinchus milii TaxID=7868 RepID=A0A4W3HRS8_CALMI